MKNLDIEIYNNINSYININDYLLEIPKYNIRDDIVKNAFNSKIYTYILDKMKTNIKYHQCNLFYVQ